MVKSKTNVEEKMKDRISTAGKYLERGMEDAEDPIDVLLSDVEGAQKKLLEGLQDAIKRGNYKIGLERAKSRDAWRTSKGRAAAHFEERADDIVERSMETYDSRMACVEKAQKEIAKMPKATRAQRIARSTKYQEITGECYDKLFGRK